MNSSGRRFQLGLVVGKFAPLHAGHERLIAQAEKRCERLLLLSYSQPEYARCGANTRRRWLQQRYPSHECIVLDAASLRTLCEARALALQPLPPNDAPDGVQQHYLAWLLRDVLQRRPDAMFAGDAYVEPCAQVLSAALGTPVQPVWVDRRDDALGVSGRVIRADPVAHWGALSAAVRASFVRRVAVLGGESSGKTTLAEALARAQGTVWVAEYGRERWEQCGGRLTREDLVAIAHEQVRREERLLHEARAWLVCDTSPLTTLGYHGWMFGDAAPPELAAAAQRPYDAIVLCAPDFAFVQDGTRRPGAFRDEQHGWYLDQLSRRGSAYCLATGSVAQRVHQVSRWLAGMP